MKQKNQSSNTLIFIMLKTLAVVMVLITCGCGGESLGVEKKFQGYKKLLYKFLWGPILPLTQKWMSNFS